MKRILLLAALPQEYAHLKKLSGPWRRLGRKPYPVYVHRSGDWELFLVETGMGQERLEEVFQWLSKMPRPDFILNFGFVGALSRDLPIGSVVLGERFLPYDLSEGLSPGKAIEFSAGPELMEFCERHGVRPTRVVTTRRPVPKHSIEGLFLDIPTVLDMESAVAARHALSNHIPFLCICSVSDAADDEIDFELESIMDSRGFVSVRKVLLAVLREPRLVKSFYINWKRCSIASRSMGKVVADLLALHASVRDDPSRAGVHWCTAKGKGGA